MLTLLGEYVEQEAHEVLNAHAQHGIISEHALVKELADVPLEVRFVALPEAVKRASVPKRSQVVVYVF